MPRLIGELPLDAQTFLQGEEHLLDILMVFAGAGIGGGATDAVGRRIGADETDDALGSGDEEARIHALVDVAFHVGEVSVPSATEPLVERVFVVGEGIGTGDAASTAIQYGETCRKVYPVIGFICGHSLVRHYDIDISADFLANSSEGKTSFDFMLNVRKLINSTVGMLMRLVFRVALKFLKNGKAKNAEAEPAEAKTEAKTA